MKIEVNGEAREVNSATVSDALQELGWANARVATALNGTFVPRWARGSTPLTAGDRLEVLAPMQGG